MKDVVLGLDIGGTNIHCGLVTKKGIVKKEVNVLTEGWKGGKAVLNNVVKAVQPLMEYKPKSIGIGAPNCDFKTGKIGRCVNIPSDLEGVNIVNFIKDKFNIRVEADNDGNCFALGEAIFGAGKQYNYVIGITLGTGFGSGVAIHKKVYHGKGRAVELGHIAINFSGPKCNCGGIGCIEEYVSARAITRYYGENKTPLEIRKLEEKGDKKAIKTYEKFGFYLGVALVSIANSFDPEIIIVGGGISNNWKLFSKKMYQTFNERRLLDTKIVKSELKNSGILGAAALVFS